MRPMRALLAAVIACTIAALLYLSLDSGRVTPEPAPRLFSLALGGLAVIFAARAWAGSMSADRRWVPFFAGLAAGVGGYALARLALV
jgi:hypothetical protein